MNINNLKKLKKKKKKEKMKLKPNRKTSFFTSGTTVANAAPVNKDDLKSLLTSKLNPFKAAKKASKKREKKKEKEKKKKKKKKRKLCNPIFPSFCHEAKNLGIPPIILAVKQNEIDRVLEMVEEGEDLSIKG